MTVLPVSVYDRRNNYGLGLGTGRANGVPALPAPFVYAVRKDGAVGIVERERRQFE